MALSMDGKETINQYQHIEGHILALKQIRSCYSQTGQCYWHWCMSICFSIAKNGEYSASYNIIPQCSTTVGILKASAELQTALLFLRLSGTLYQHHHQLAASSLSKPCLHTTNKRSTNKSIDRREEEEIAAMYTCLGIFFYYLSSYTDLVLHNNLYRIKEN